MSTKDFGLCDETLYRTGSTALVALFSDFVMFMLYFLSNLGMFGAIYSEKSEMKIGEREIESKRCVT